MTFLVTLVALLIERFFDWSHLRQWQWFQAYQRFVTQKIPGLESYFGLGATLLPLLIVVLLCQYLFRGTLYGVISFVFQTLVLLYCFGPKNLWAEMAGDMSPLASGDSEAVERLALELDASAKNEQGLQKQLLGRILTQANQRIFAAFLWFVILGPVGAVIYRLVVVSIRTNSIPGLAQSAVVVESALSWLTVRFFSFMFALGGNFTKTIDFWTKNIKMGLVDNHQFLMGCGYAALGLQSKERPPENASLMNDCLGLVDRSLVITLIIIAFLSLIRL